MGCCASKAAPTESERLLPVSAASSSASSRVSAPVTPSPSPSASPIAPPRSTAENADTVLPGYAGTIDGAKAKEESAHHSREPSTKSNDELPSLPTLPVTEASTHSRAPSEDNSLKNDSSLSSNTAETKAASPKPRRKSLKLNLGAAKISSSNSGENPSATIDPHGSETHCLGDGDEHVSKSPRSPLSPRKIVKNISDKLTKAKARKKSDSGQGDDVADVQVTASASEESDVKFSDFPEEIRKEPTEEQKAKLHLKKSLDLRTENFAKDYFDEVDKAKPPTPVNNDPSSQEVSKKKTAKEFIKDTFKSITPKKDKKDKGEEDQPISPRGDALTSPRKEKPETPLSPRGKKEKEKEKDTDAGKSLHTKSPSGDHRQRRTSENVDTRKELRDILAQNNVKLAERGQKLEKLGETMDKMEEQSSLMRSLASQLLEEAKK